MLTDIRSRLIVSQMVVVMVTLTLAFVILVVITRPLQTRLTQLGLAVQLEKIRQPLQERLDQGNRLERLQGSIGTRLANQDFRVLILNQNHNIVFDSQGQWTGRSLTNLQLDTSNGRQLTGTDVGPGGEDFLYVATPLRVNNANRFFLALTRPLPHARTPILAELGSGFVVAGIIAFVLSLLLSFLVARSVARPLRTIAQAAEAIAQKDYSLEVAETGPDEVRQVARSFNSMARQVRAGQEAMRDFVSNVSHELRTPLTSIRGFSQALLDGAAQDEAAKNRAATIIFDEADRMHRLVEDLLDLARIDAGTLTINKHPLDLPALLDFTLHSLSPQATAKYLKLNRDYQNLPLAMGDGDRLIQVFTNLLDNAIKHTPPGGKITVTGSLEIPASAAKDGKHRPAAPDGNRPYARITVADNGPGIDPAELNRIFERFYQVDKSRHRDLGTGLGLSIAHDIVAAHGGSIRAESAPGQGMRFTLWLPAATENSPTTTPSSAWPVP